MAEPLAKSVRDLQDELDELVSRHHGELRAAVSRLLARACDGAGGVAGDVAEAVFSPFSPDHGDDGRRHEWIDAPAVATRSAPSSAGRGADGCWIPSAPTGSRPLPLAPSKSMLQVMPVSEPEDSEDAEAVGPKGSKPLPEPWWRAKSGPISRSATQNSIAEGESSQQKGFFGNLSARMTGSLGFKKGEKETRFQQAKNQRRRALRNARSDRLIFEHTREHAHLEHSWLQRLTRHRCYEYMVGLLIFGNSMFTGFAVQYEALSSWKQAVSGVPGDVVLERGPVEAVQVVFCLVFGVELGMRWTAEGLLGFFTHEDIGWSCFDVFVVGFGLLDVVTFIFPVGSDMLENGSVLRAIRVLRVIRMARMIRIMRFFRELRLMVLATIGSLRSLLWVFFILAVLFGIVSISIVSAVTSYLNSTQGWLEIENQPLVDGFGFIEGSVLTLFMSMSGGVDWGDVYKLLAPLPFVHRLVYLIFISFSLFALMNILTGIFVDTALQCNISDKDMVISEELHRQQEYKARMREVFEEIDINETGSISLDEFEAKLDDERVIAYFNALKLEVSDARQLFLLLDYDQSGEIVLEEFIDGCHKLKGESRGLDLAVMSLEVRWLSQALMNLQEFCENKLEFDGRGLGPAPTARLGNKSAAEDAADQPASSG